MMEYKEFRFAEGYIAGSIEKLFKMCCMGIRTDAV
jgi:hypothetical protein